MLATTAPGLVVYLVATYVLGVVGVLSVIRQPRRAFQAAGHSKYLWLLIELLGLVFVLGALTFLIYRIWILPGVRKAGGHRRQKSTSSYQGRPVPAPTSSYGNSYSLPDIPRPKCGQCSGSGRTVCYPCQASGYTRYDDGTTTTCPACGGQRDIVCASCLGSGLQ